MGHRTFWLPALLGSVGFVSFNPAAAQVASGSLWGMGAERPENEPEIEPSGPQIAPAHLWGFDAPQPAGGVVLYAAESNRQFVQAPAPVAPVVAMNFADTDAAVLVQAFAQQAAAPVEDEREDGAWSRDPVRVAAGDWEFRAAPDERGAPFRQAEGLFAPSAVQYAPDVVDEALTVNILPPKNRVVPTRQAVLANESLLAPKALLPVNQVMASVTRKRKRAAPYRQAAAMVTISYAPADVDEALIVDIARPKKKPTRPKSDLMRPKSFALPKTLLPIEQAVAPAVRKRKGPPPYRQVAGLLAPVAVSYAPVATDPALTVDAARLKNSPPPHSSDVMFVGSLATPMPVRMPIQLAMAPAAPEWENVNPDGQFSAQFAPVAVSYEPLAKVETLTMDVASLGNSLPSHSSDVMFTGNLGTRAALRVPIELAMAPANSEFGNVDPQGQVAALFSLVSASYASFATGETLIIDTVRWENSAPSHGSNFVLAPKIITSSRELAQIQRGLNCRDCSNYVRGEACCLEMLSSSPEIRLLHL